MLKRSNLLYVEFVDHGSGVGWMPDNEINISESAPHNICHAVGWLISENKRFICLCPFRDENGQSHVRQYIIKAAITKTYRLKIPK